MTTPITYSISQFARIVGISESSARKMAKEGSIATVMVGKMRRIPHWAIPSQPQSHAMPQQPAAAPTA